MAANDDARPQATDIHPSSQATPQAEGQGLPPEAFDAIVQHADTLPDAPQAAPAQPPQEPDMDALIDGFSMDDLIDNYQPPSDEYAAINKNIHQVSGVLGSAALGAASSTRPCAIRLALTLRPSLMTVKPRGA